MRRLLILLQLLLLNLPTFAAAAVLHADRAGATPVCCRRSGVHHCGMAGMEASTALGEPAISVVPQHCPYCPKALPSTQHSPAALAAHAAIFALVVSHPACVAQTLARRRISQDRGRQKRGPPTLT